MTGGAFLSQITAGDLVWLRGREDEEDFGAMTCRPIHRRSGEALLDVYQSALDDPEKVVRGLWLPCAERPIGKLTATDWNPRNRSMEIGYFLRREFRHKGYMYFALHAFCELLFRERSCNKIIAQTGSFNTPSIHLLETCGFHRDGVLRQHHERNGTLLDDYLYSLLAEEYRNSLESRE